MEFSTPHHIALICHDRTKALHFYRDILGFTLTAEHVRPEKNDILLLLRKAELVLELFIKPDAPARVSGSTGEACGLRHLAFKTADVEKAKRYLEAQNVKCEAIRNDDFDGKKMLFFFDPDGLPLELHE